LIWQNPCLISNVFPVKEGQALPNFHGMCWKHLTPVDPETLRYSMTGVWASYWPPDWLGRVESYTTFVIKTGSPVGALLHISTCALLERWLQLLMSRIDTDVILWSSAVLRQSEIGHQLQFESKNK
jgi:hypothetical protein